MLHSGSGLGDVDCVMNDGESGDGLTLIVSWIPHLIAVVDYIKSDGNMLDVWQSCSMHAHGELWELRDRQGVMRDTAIGAWIKHCNHWGRSDAAECEASSSEMDILQCCSFEKDVYEHILSLLIASVVLTNVQLDMYDDGASASPST